MNELPIPVSSRVAGKACFAQTLARLIGQSGSFPFHSFLVYDGVAVPSLPDTEARQ